MAPPRRLLFPHSKSVRSRFHNTKASCPRQPSQQDLHGHGKLEPHAAHKTGRGYYDPSTGPYVEEGRSGLSCRCSLFPKVDPPPYKPDQQRMNLCSGNFHGLAALGREQNGLDTV
jgi:hypothetical protein